MLRLLSALLVALALFVSPVAMANGMAMTQGQSIQGQSAQGPSTQGMAMDDHCGGVGQSSDDRRADIQISCASACAALHPAPLVFADPIEEIRIAAVVPSPRNLAGIGPERETPPPRTSPRI